MKGFKKIQEVLSSLYRALTKVVGDFSRDEKGGIAVIAGVTLVPLLTLSSVGIELTRVSHTQTKIAYASDAAALAAARYRLSDAQENAIKFFNANFDRDRFNVELDTTLSISEDNKTFVLRVNGEIATYFSDVLGVASVPFDFSTTILRELGGVEVALVLDNSGSMSGNKLTSLKKASKALVDSLYEETETLDNIAISIVPYSSSVSLDASNPNQYADWMRDSWPHASPGWGGCVEVRDTLSYRLDDTPPGTDSATQFNHYDYRKVFSGFFSVFVNPNSSCPLGIMPLTNQSSVLKDHLDLMQANGSTVGPFGLVWGWRALSPRWQGKWGGINPKDYETPDNRKAIVMMTDGDNFANSNYTAYYSIVGEDGYSRTNLDNEMAQICEKIKEKNIEIYTVTFRLNSSNTKALYRQCATRDTNYYDAETNADLEDMFEKIAESIKIIRIKS